MSDYKFFVTCPIGMEELVIEELKAQKIQRPKKTRGGIHFSCYLEKGIRFLYATKFSSRLYGEVDFFKVKSEEELYHKCLRQNWSKLMGFRDTFKVNCQLSKEPKRSKMFRNSHFISLKVKDAICDYFQDKEGSRPDVERRQPDHLFYLYAHMRKDFSVQCTLYQDLGGLLSNRGYRSEKFMAPLRENLAAAIVQATEWHHEKETFMDIMCGSGTLLIEALMQKYNLSPQYLKVIEGWDFPYENSPTFGFKADAIKDEIKKNFEAAKSGKVYGNDILAQSIDASKAHLKNAQLEHLVEFTQIDAVQIKPKSGKPGVVICNPPYGERLSDKDTVERLYHYVGENMKRNFKEWRWYLFTGSPEMRKSVGLQTSKRIPMFNGDIECRLFEYKLF